VSVSYSDSVPSAVKYISSAKTCPIRRLSADASRKEKPARIREHRINSPSARVPVDVRRSSLAVAAFVDAGAWQDILAAVEELHRLGYVHRDLKPANVLLVENKWMLADFGLILPMARDTTILTSSKSAYGSHFYAAPEQAKDFRNTPEQADIFALGCILHDAVEPDALRVPFAQFRAGGTYGPILEKCTESESKKRFLAKTQNASFIFSGNVDDCVNVKGKDATPIKSDPYSCFCEKNFVNSRWKSGVYAKINVISVCFSVKFASTK